MRFDPKKASRALTGLHAGVMKVEEKVSKAGNDMLAVTLTVDGGNRKVWDYLGEWNLWKLRELCEAVGKLDAFKAGDVGSRDLDGLRVGVELIEDPDQPDRSQVDRYLPAVEAVGGAATTDQADEGEDLPFGWFVVVPLVHALMQVVA